MAETPDPSQTLALALVFAEQGIPAGPIAIGWDEGKQKTNKRPLTKHGHQSFTTVERLLTADLFRSAAGRMRPGEVLGVGLYPGRAGFVVLDPDVGDPDGRAILAALEAQHGALPDHPIVDTASGGEHRWFRKPDGAQIGNPDFAPGINVRSDDGWVVAPGVVTPWGSWTLRDGTPLSDAPEPPGWALDRLDVRPAEGAGNGSGPFTQPAGSTGGRGRWQALDKTKLEPRDLAALEALERLGGHGAYLTSNGEIQITRPGKTAGASATIGHIGPGIAKVFTDDWPPLEQNARYDADELAELAEAPPDEEADATPGEGAARDGDAEPGDADDVGGQRAQGTPQSGELGALADGHRATDAGNAQRLLGFARSRIRYAPKRGKWLVYRGGVWEVDDGDVHLNGQAQVVAHRMFRSAAREEDPKRREDLWKWAKQSEKAPSIAAMIRLARPYVRIDESDLDADPWLFNVQNGTVDLRTGKLRDHDPDDLLTMQAPVTYDQDAEAPLWAECVERWQPDEDRRGFLQRAVGSGISGQPIERFFVNLGNGGNGKSKFFDSIANVLGPYFTTPDQSLLVSQRFEPHEEVKADLFRTRMVVGAETGESDKLADSKIKDLTGGTAVFKASRKFEHRFKFSQTWTMFMHTNHRPQISDLSDGMWRRVRLISWDVKIPEDEQDGELLDKLTAEGGGILNWLIEGCLALQRHGWNEPASVRNATSAWRGDEDTFTRWLDDSTRTGPGYYATAGELHDSYTAWCGTTGAELMSKKAFGAELKERYDSDQMRVNGKNTRVWLGVDLVDGGQLPGGNWDPARNPVDVDAIFADKSAGHSDE